MELVKHYGFAQRDIDPGPGMASFLPLGLEIVYDPSITIDFTESKLEHIIDDGIRRNRFPKKYTVSQTGKPIPPWSLAQMLNNAIKISCMMAQRNYKYVIPQYRPGGVEYVGGKRFRYEGQIQFLMPIYLSADYFSPRTSPWSSPGATGSTFRRRFCSFPGRTTTRASCASRTTAG